MIEIGSPVTTPYGTGTCKSVRESDGIVLVEPNSWALANKKPPTFFLNAKDVKIVENVADQLSITGTSSSTLPMPSSSSVFEIGDQVKCSFGDGYIKSVRSDGIYVIELENWKLATGKSPTLYLQSHSISRREPVELSPGVNVIKSAAQLFEDHLELSLQHKAEAAALFEKKSYAAAKDKYIEALNAIRSDVKELSNEHKARAFEQTVPCYNNIALCCLNLGEIADSIPWAQNATSLIQSIEDRILSGKSEVWLSLEKDRGITHDKLMEWKKKSYFYVGRAYHAHHDYKEAISNYEFAVKTHMQLSDPHGSKAVADLNKIKDQLATVKKAYANELKKEKSTWSKAFKENNLLPENNEDIDSSKNTLSDKQSNSVVKSIINSKKANNPGRNNGGHGILTTHSFYTWVLGIGLFGAFTAAAFIILRKKRFV